MDYRTLGRTGCAVSTLTLGTMTFGKETDEPAAHEQLDAFFEAGGNLVDTADVYNAGVSEEIIGRWLADRPADVRDNAVIATKGRFPMGEGTNDLGIRGATCSVRSTRRCVGSASTASTSTRSTPGTR